MSTATATSTLNATQARYLGYIKSVIRERGVDFVYEPPETAKQCVYNANFGRCDPVTGRPLPRVGSCIIGKVVIDHAKVDQTAVRIDRLGEGVAFGPELALSVLGEETVTELGDRFVWAMGRAQYDQDGAMEYGTVWRNFIGNLTSLSIAWAPGEALTLTAEEASL